MKRKRKTTILVVIIVAIVLSTSVLYIFYRQPEFSVVEGKNTINFEGDIWNISSVNPAILANSSLTTITQANAPISSFQLNLTGWIVPYIANSSGGGSELTMNVSFNGSILDNLHPSSVTLHIDGSGIEANSTNSYSQLVSYTQKNVNTTKLTSKSNLYSFGWNSSVSSILRLTNSPLLLQFEHNRDSFYNFSYSGKFQIYFYWNTPSTRYFNVTATLNGLPSPVSATVNTEVANVF